MLGVNDLRRYLAEEFGITTDRALDAAMKGMHGINIAVFTAGADERREGIEREADGGQEVRGACDWPATA